MVYNNEDNDIDTFIVEQHQINKESKSNNDDNDHNDDDNNDDNNDNNNENKNDKNYMFEDSSYGPMWSLFSFEKCFSERVG